MIEYIILGIDFLAFILSIIALVLMIKNQEKGLVILGLLLVIILCDMLSLLSLYFSYANSLFLIPLTALVVFIFVLDN